MSNKESVKEFRRNRKKDLVAVMGGCCSICGYSKSISALDFHHIDPKKKTYQLSSGNTMSLVRDLEEVQKCALVCANCHREIHHEEVSGVHSTYSEERAQKLLTSKEGVRATYNCTVCGSDLSRKTKTGKCASCYSESRSGVDKPSRETLKSLVRKESFVSIGKRYGVSDNAVRKWCKKLSLPSRKSDILKYTAQDWDAV